MAAALAALALALGCAGQNAFAPATAEEPHAEVTAKFLNVRHEPDAAWGKGGFRPRLEVCEGRQPGCGRVWCYDCDPASPVRQSKVSATSVAATLLLPTRELTITAFTHEPAGECRADPLTIAPKKGLQYELVYSHVWSGADKSSYRCAATLERAGEEDAPPEEAAPPADPEAGVDAPESPAEPAPSSAPGTP